MRLKMLMAAVVAAASAGAAYSDSTERQAESPAHANARTPAHPLFYDDFEVGLDGWEFPVGDGYDVVPTDDPDGNHALALQTRGQPVYALMRGSEAWDGVRIEGRVLFPDSGHSYLGFIYRYADDGRRRDFGSLYIKGNNSYVQANPHHDTNVGRTVYPEIRAALEGASAIRIGEWQDFALEVIGGEAHLYVGPGRTPEMTLPFAPTRAGAFGFKPRNPGDPVWIDDIRVRPLAGFTWRGPRVPETSYASVEHVVDWQVLGPLTRMRPEVEGRPFDPALRVQDDGRTVGWRPFPVDARGAVVTGRVTEYRGARRVAYFHTTLPSETQRDVLLAFGTADDLALWLNGEFLGYGSRTARAWWDAGVNPDHPALRARGTLRPGDNHLVVRVTGGVYATGGFFLAVREPEAGGGPGGR